MTPAGAEGHIRHGHMTTIVPQTPYHHDSHGRVDVIDVRPDEVVVFKDASGRLRFAGVDAFDAATEPAAQSIQTPTTTAGSDATL